jgi:hypothetical protein
MREAVNSIVPTIKKTYRYSTPKTGSCMSRILSLPLLLKILANAVINNNIAAVNTKNLTQFILQNETCISGY